MFSVISGTLVGGSYLCAEKQSVDSATPADWARDPIGCYHPRSEWTWDRWQKKGTPHSANYWNPSVRLFSVISEHSLGEYYLSAEKQSVYSTALADWAMILFEVKKTVQDKSHFLNELITEDWCSWWHCLDLTFKRNFQT